MPRATCQTSVHFRFSAILIKSFFHLTQFLSLCNVRLQWPLYIGLIATITESEMVFWDWTALGAFLKCIGGIQSKAISIDLVHNMYLSTNLPFHICSHSCFSPNSPESSWGRTPRYVRAPQKLAKHTGCSRAKLNSIHWNPERQLQEGNPSLPAPHRASLDFGFCFVCFYFASACHFL